MAKAKKETMAKYYQDPLHLQIKRLHSRKSGYKRRNNILMVSEMEKQICILHELKNQRKDTIFT